MMTVKAAQSPPANGKILYCAAFRRFQLGRWEATFEYLHADDLGQAKFKFAVGIQKGYRLGDNLLLDGIAPVVGVFVEDEKRLIFTV